MKKHRFYLFTGKGGVGKTYVSLAFAKYLSLQKKEVYYCCPEQDNKQLCYELNIKYLGLDWENSAKQYITKKLNSKIIASWIVKRAFFRSIANMLSNVKRMIYLGHIMDMLEQNQNMIIVMDSPATGHFLNIFHIPNVFRKIFKYGVIVDDIKRMHNFIQEKDLLKTIVLSIPSAMSFQEVSDLKSSLEMPNIGQETLIINNYLGDMNEIYEKAPEFLQKKINIEREMAKEHKDQIKAYIPHIISNNKKDIINNLIPFMNQIL